MVNQLTKILRDGSEPVTRTVKTSRPLKLVLVAGLVIISLSRIVAYLDYTRSYYVVDNDLMPDYVSAMEWRDGGNPYDPLRGLYAEHLPGVHTRFEADQRNSHPPPLIVLLAPLSFLTPYGARVTMLVVSIAAILLAAYLFARQVGVGRWFAAAIALMVLALPISEFGLDWAQIDGVMLLALVVGWSCIRSGRDSPAGVLIGLAISLKIFPWMLLIPLVRLRKWAVVKWAVVGAACSLLLSTAILGFGATSSFVTEASRSNFRIWAAADNGLSLVAAPFRWFASGLTDNPAMSIPWFVWVLAVGAILVCVFGAWITAASESRDIFWATIPWMILASPLAWASSLVLVIPLGLLLLRRLPTMARVTQCLVVLSVVVVSLGQRVGERFGLAGIHTVDRLQTRIGMSIVIAALLSIAVLDARRIGKSSPTQAI